MIPLHGDRRGTWRQQPRSEESRRGGSKPFRLRRLGGHIPSEHSATLWERPLAQPDAWRRATGLRRSGRVLCPGQMPGPGQRMLRVLWVPRELPLSRDSGPFLGRKPLVAKRLPADGTSGLRRSGRVLCPGQMPGAGQRGLRRSGRVLCPGTLGPFLAVTPWQTKRLRADGTLGLRRSGRVLCPGQMPGAGQRGLRRSGRVLCPGQIPPEQGNGCYRCQESYLCPGASGPFLAVTPWQTKRLRADGASGLRRSGRVLWVRFRPILP